MQTDNSTFFSAAMCLFGRENFWFIASPKKLLDEDTMGDALENLEMLGYNTDRDFYEENNAKFRFLGFGVFAGNCEV